MIEALCVTICRHPIIIPKQWYSGTGTHITDSWEYNNSQCSFFFNTKFETQFHGMNNEIKILEKLRCLYKNNLNNLHVDGSHNVAPRSSCCWQCCDEIRWHLLENLLYPGRKGKESLKNYPAFLSRKIALLHHALTTSK